MKRYSYNYINNSLLGPFFHTRLIDPLMKRIPSDLSANWITLSSWILSTAGLLSTFIFGHTILGVLLTSLFYFLYAICDCLDGSFARHTNSESALGEFLDHMHDIYAIAAVHITFCHYFQISSPAVIVFIFCTSYLYAAERFHLLYKTGCMEFPKFGTWEQLLVTLSIFTISLIPQVHELLVSWVFLIAPLITGVNFLFSVKNYLKAMKEEHFFTLYFFLSLSFLYLLRPYSNPQIILFIIFYNLHFIGSVISRRLTFSSYPMPDLVAPQLLLLGFYEIAIAYLTARIFWLLFITLNGIPTDDDS